MQIKITPLTTKHAHLEGEFTIGHNYYLAEFHSAGLVTEIKKDDDWLESEMSWVSRSEIPFITALRHAQLSEMHLVEGANLPVVRTHGPFYEKLTVNRFPSPKECRQLVYKQCDNTNDDKYDFYKREIKRDDVEQLFNAFNYRNDLWLRAGSCLYKAYILLGTSSLFAEEIYVNTFIALEAIMEHLIAARSLTRDKVIEIIGDFLKKDHPGIDFRDYEEEMRDGIRNNIIHPYRRSGETNAQPFLMADYIYEDLETVDWIFKKLIQGFI